MDAQVMIQSTPNPNALKFVLNTPVRSEGNVTYKNSDECEENPMAKVLFELNSAIKEVYFFDNYITVTQDGSTDWDELEERIKTTILANITNHNPDFKVTEKKDESVGTTVTETPELIRINEILDQTVRPALQMDGGDIQLADYNNNVLKVFYQGACGTCPSATMGTMKAIENILRDQFNPDLTVELAENF